jgi:RES domain-containing protein
MIVYRFSHLQFASDLSGYGARIKGGRWNPVGISVLYTSESISLALLEILANALSLKELKMFHLMEIEVPKINSIQEIKLEHLKKEWYFDFDYTQWMGKEVLQSNQSLLVKCPSALVHKEHNYLINPLHKDFKKIALGKTADFYFDERLFKKQTN